MEKHPVQVIAEESPEAAGLISTLVDYNRRELEWLDAQILGGVERERDQWKQRAIDAEDRLIRIESRLFKLLA